MQGRSLENLHCQLSYMNNITSGVTPEALSRSIAIRYLLKARAMA
jgi:hypothetical protein